MTGNLTPFVACDGRNNPTERVAGSCSGFPSSEWLVNVITSSRASAADNPVCATNADASTAHNAPRSRRRAEADSLPPNALPSVL